MKFSALRILPLVSIFALATTSMAKRKELIAYTEFEPNEINESSGLVKSRFLSDTYWTHNDSGDSARIFAIKRNGAAIRPAWEDGEYKGLSVADAVNIDWEELAADNDGNLYIGAFGNIKVELAVSD